MLRRLSAKLEEFTHGRDSEHLRQAIELIEAWMDSTGDSTGHSVQEVLRAWIQLFETLDAAIEPGWDSRDLPETGLIPPGAAGVVFPSGVDPAAIRDPDVRRDYEQMLQEAKAKAERFGLQQDLRRLDERAMYGWWLLGDVASGSGTDLAAIDRALSDSSVIDARRTKLLEVWQQGQAGS
jgi:hypothetical protein